jgi:predicted nucleic acid-binding protein
MDRVFLDANVLFSAAYRTDAALRRLWELTGVGLVTSSYAVEEARRNLDTPQRKTDLENLLEDMEVIIDMIPDEPLPLPEPGLPDKDLPILMAAVNTGATHLLTGDFKHFGPHYGRAIGYTMILTPAGYLRSYYERH